MRARACMTRPIVRAPPEQSLPLQTCARKKAFTFFLDALRCLQKEAGDQDHPCQ